MAFASAMDTVAQAASAVVRHSTLVIGAAADELARQVGNVRSWGKSGDVHLQKNIVLKL